MTCPGYDATKVRPMTEEAHTRLVCEGTARQYHLAAGHPHLFCGCGSEAAVCHPGRCCRDDDWGLCVNCGRPTPEVIPPPEPEDRYSDPLFEVTP